MSIKVPDAEYWEERKKPGGSTLLTQVAPLPTMRKPPAVNWDKWLNMPVMALWEAIALSCNIEPDQDTAVGQVFEDRMHIAISHLASGRLLHIEANVPSRVAFAPVSLVDIARLAKSCRWPVPAEFPKAEASPIPAPVVAESASGGVEPAKVGPVNENPWLVIDRSDPSAIQPWYTPARYFARQLVMEDSTLLQKRSVLADKVSKSLAAAGIKKRGGKLAFNSDTVLKAFAKVVLG